MRDRCYLTLTIRAEDRPQLEALLHGPLEGWWDHVELRAQHDSPLLDLVAEEATVGRAAARAQWATAGLAFLGEQGSGGAFPEAVFVSHAGTLYEVPALDCVPIAKLYRNGPDPDTLRRIQAYYAAEAAVSTAFGLLSTLAAAEEAAVHHPPATLYLVWDEFLGQCQREDGAPVEHAASPETGARGAAPAKAQA